MIEWQKCVSSVNRYRCSYKQDWVIVRSITTISLFECYSVYFLLTNHEEYGHAVLSDCESNLERIELLFPWHSVQDPGRNVNRQLQMLSLGEQWIPTAEIVMILAGANLYF